MKRRRAYAPAVKRIFDWCDQRRLELADIEAITGLYRTARHEKPVSGLTNNTWPLFAGCSII
jgi:hypothetical protein